MPDKKHTSQAAAERYTLLEDARRELHHHAHVYANTKDERNKPQASDQLDAAAIAFAMAAAVYGAKEK